MRRPKVSQQTLRFDCPYSTGELFAGCYSESNVPLCHLDQGYALVRVPSCNRWMTSRACYIHAISFLTPLSTLVNQQYAHQGCRKAQFVLGRGTGEDII